MCTRLLGKPNYHQRRRSRAERPVTTGSRVRNRETGEGESATPQRRARTNGLRTRRERQRTGQKESQARALASEWSWERRATSRQECSRGLSDCDANASPVCRRTSIETRTRPHRCRRGSRTVRVADHRRDSKGVCSKAMTMDPREQVEAAKARVRRTEHKPKRTRTQGRGNGRVLQPTLAVRVGVCGAATQRDANSGGTLGWTCWRCAHVAVVNLCGARFRCRGGALNQQTSHPIKSRVDVRNQDTTCQ